MNLETFSLSGYQIAWNKCIDPIQKNHPGAVTEIASSPADPGKILIAYRSGLICLWDLTAKKGEQRFNYSGSSTLHSVCWHKDGQQFAASYADGALVTWPLNKPGGSASCAASKPAQVLFPHAAKKAEKTPCDPIEKVIWRTNRSSGQDYFVFSGGLPVDVMGVTPSITLLQGKNTTLLEMENDVIDFLLVSDSPYASDYQEPEAILVMLSNDLVAIDCNGKSFPCFQNPYGAMDFATESEVTCCEYMVDCPGDLIPALYMAGSKAKADKDGNKSNFSRGEWPINGGSGSSGAAAESYCSYTELVVTGHADGTIKFWDASSTSFQSLYRLKTAKYFEKVKSETSLPTMENPYSVCRISLCGDSRELAVAEASGQVLFFRFRSKKTEDQQSAVTETKAMEVPIVYEVSSAASKHNSHSASNSPKMKTQHFEFPTPKPALDVASQSASYTDPVDGFNFDKPQYEYFSPLRLRQQATANPPQRGFHPELVCLTPWVNGEAPSAVNALEVNADFGLMAYGNGSGLVIVDVVQFVCLLNMGTADLYGGVDPFQRLPKSPKPLDSGLGAADIVRVDLGSYSQVDTPSSSTLEKPPTSSRVKSPDCRRLLLQKAGGSGGSADEGVIGGMKSRSSSTNSLDAGDEFADNNAVVAQEGVTHVHFADSFSTKGDFSSLGPTLYVGTSLGSLIAVIINMPDRGEPRNTEPVVVSPSGSLYRATSRGDVLAIAFLDASAKTMTVREGEAAVNVKIPAKKPVAEDEVVVNGADQQIAVVCTEKSAAVYALPSQRRMYTQSIAESSSAVAASVINFGGTKYAPCLVAMTADGFLKAYGLPSLRPMMDVYFAAKTPRLERTIAFSDYGHGLYFANPNEVQKFTISADFVRQLPEMRGEGVFQEGVPTPEPPKQGFLKGLFGGGPKPCDREELFGEQAGKVSATTATVTGSGTVAMASKGASAASEVGKARQAFVERGEKLNQLEDRTEQMADEAKQYRDNARALLNKEKNRKWYQL